MMDSDGDSGGRPEALQRPAQQDPDRPVSAAFRRQLRAARMLCTRIICRLRATERKTNVHASADDDNGTTTAAATAAAEFDLMRFSDEDLSHTSGELTVTCRAVREDIAVGGSTVTVSKNNVDFATSRVLDSQDNDNAVDREIERCPRVPYVVAETADDGPNPATVDQMTAECSNDVIATSDHDDDLQLLHDLQQAPRNVPTTTTTTTTTVGPGKRSKTSAALHRVQG